MNEKRDFKGVWIEKKIWLNKDLSWMEKLLLTEIDSLDNEDSCFAGNKYFAEFFGLSENRISKMIKSLKDKGYVEVNLIRDGFVVKKREIKVNQKMLTTNVKKSIGTDGEKSIGTDGENDKYNNTLINNTNNNKKQSAAKATNRNVKEYDIESDEYKLVELFVKQMQKVNELFKAPSNYNTWCKDMSLILDKDLTKISDDKNERRKIAQQIIIHSCNKTFYSKNIRSINKLRGRLDEVWMDLKSDKGYNNFKTNNLEQPSKPINVWTPDQMFMQE